MLFIHPMWHSESQRIGKQKCTPVGYTLHGIADLLGCGGLLMLPVSTGVLTYHAIFGIFHVSLLWLLALPFGAGLLSEVLYHFSWWLALRKDFRYDDAKREASWLEEGQRRSYKWQS